MKLAGYASLFSSLAAQANSRVVRRRWTPRAALDRLQPEQGRILGGSNDRCRRPWGSECCIRVVPRHAPYRQAVVRWGISGRRGVQTPSTETSKTGFGRPGATNDGNVLRADIAGALRADLANSRGASASGIPPGPLSRHHPLLNSQAAIHVLRQIAAAIDTDQGSRRSDQSPHSSRTQPSR